MGKAKPASATERLANYLKQNKFMTGVVVAGVVAVVAIAGVLAATNDNTNKPNDKPATSQSDEPKQDDKKPDTAAAPATSGNQTTGVLGETVTANQGHVATVTQATAVVPVVTAPAIHTPVVVNPGNNDEDETDPETPVVPTKFDKARVSLTFDDGWKSIHENALPYLQQYGLVSTQYVNSDPTLKSDPASSVYDYWTGYMNFAQIKDFADAGHEIAWHTNTHVHDLTTATAQQRIDELQPTTEFLDMLTNAGVTLSDNLAAPFGTHSAEAAAAAQVNGYNSYRTTYDGYNTKSNFDPMKISVKNVCGVDGVEACNGHKTTATEVANWIAEAKAQNAWLVIVYHEVADVSIENSVYSITVAEFAAQVQAVAESGVDVVTVQQALQELKAQM